MKTTFDFYLNGTAATHNGENGEAHLSGYDEMVSPDRFEPSVLGHVNSEALLRELLRRIGENPDREGLQQTPARIIRSWSELFSGYSKLTEEVLTRNSTPNNTTQWCFCATSSSTLLASIICCLSLGRPTLPTYPAGKLWVYRN